MENVYTLTLCWKCHRWRTVRTTGTRGDTGVWRPIFAASTRSATATTPPAAYSWFCSTSCAPRTASGWPETCGGEGQSEGGITWERKSLRGGTTLVMSSFSKVNIVVTHEKSGVGKRVLFFPNATTVLLLAFSSFCPACTTQSCTAHKQRAFWKGKKGRTCLLRTYTILITWLEWGLWPSNREVFWQKELIFVPESQWKKLLFLFFLLWTLFHSVLAYPRIGDICSCE